MIPQLIIVISCILVGFFLVKDGMKYHSVLDTIMGFIVLIAVFILVSVLYGN